MKSTFIIAFGLLTCCCGGMEAYKRATQKSFNKPLDVELKDLCVRMPDGLLMGDSENCQSFYYCLNHSAEKLQCRDGYHFDTESSFCVKGSCPKPQLPVKERCNAKFELFRRVEDKCTDFKLCKEGVFERFECPAGFFFESENNRCLPIKDTPAHKCACVMPERMVMAHENNCQAYYVCQEGNALMNYCAAGQYFSTHYNACMPDTSGTCAMTNDKHRPMPAEAEVLAINVARPKPATDSSQTHGIQKQPTDSDHKHGGMSATQKHMLLASLHKELGGKKHEESKQKDTGKDKAIICDSKNMEKQNHNQNQLQGSGKKPTLHTNPQGETGAAYEKYYSKFVAHEF